MAEQSFLAKMGMRTGTVGSMATLAVAFGNNGGVTPESVRTAANRTGFYADLTAAAEFIGNVIGGSERMRIAAGSTTISYSATAIGSLPAATAGTVLRVVNVTGTPTRLLVDAFGTGSGALITSRFARGTPAAPTAVQSGDTLGSHNAYGYGATGYSASFRGRFAVTAAENWTDAAQGTALVLAITTNGTTSTYSAATLGNDGVFTLRNGTNTGLALQPQGGAAAFVGTITTAVLSANRTYTFPDATGTVIVNSGGSIAAGQVAFGDGGGGITGSDKMVFVTTPILTINANALATASLPAATTGTVLRLVSTDAAPVRLLVDAFGSGSGALVTSRFARGTAAAPTAVQSGDTLGSHNAYGYGATGYSASFRARFAILAAENWTDAAQGTTIVFDTTARTTTTTATRGIVDNAGVLSWGGNNNGLATFTDSTVTPLIQGIGTGVTALGLTRFSATSAPQIYLARSDGATVGDYTAVAANDVLGLINFQGSDGTDLSQSVVLQASVDVGATVSAGIVPGRLRFQTTTSAGSTSQALFIDSAQVVAVTTSTAAIGTIFTGGTAKPAFQVLSTAGNAAVGISRWNAGAAGAPSFYLAHSRSGTIGTAGVITTGDTLGTISFQGDDGTNFVASSAIIGVSTGTIGTNQIPGILRIQTAASAGTLTTAGQIDSTQNWIIGNTATTSASTYTGGTITPRIQVKGTSSTTAGASIGLALFQGNAAPGANLYLAKSRSGTIDTMTIVVTGDTLGNVDYQGADGTNFVSAAAISGTAEGTVGAGAIPGRLTFKTATAAGTITEGIRLDSGQITVVSNGGSAANTVFTGGTVTPRLQVVTQAAGVQATMSMTAFSSANSPPSIIIAKSKGNSFNTMTVVATGDTIGIHDWQGADGTNFVSAARIVAFAEGTIGAAQIPGRLSFQTATSAGTITEAGRIDSAQVWVVGTGFTSQATFTASTITPRFQNITTTAGVGSANMQFNATAGNGAFMYLARSKSGTVGTYTAVTTADQLGRIDAQGADGTDLASSAQINFIVDAAVAADQVPGRISFSTATGGGTITEAMRITSGQIVVVGATGQLSTFTGSSLTPVLQLVNTTAGGTMFGIARFPGATAASPTRISLARSRGASVGTYTAVAAGDDLGWVTSEGADGTDFAASAQIVFQVDAAVSNNIVPGRIIFQVGIPGTGALSESMRITSAQNVTVSPGNDSLTTYSGTTITPKFQIIYGGTSQSSIGIARFNSTAGNGPILFMGRSKFAGIGQYDAVAAGDVLGDINVQGSDGTDFAAAALIRVTCGGTVANNQVPGAFDFQTANAAGTLTSAVTIDSNQSHNKKFGQGWGVTNIATAAGTTTLVATSTVVQIFTGATTQTVVLPAANLLGAGIGVLYVIKNRSSGALTVNRAGSDTIDGGTTTNVAAGASITLISNGVSEWVLC